MTQPVNRLCSIHDYYDTKHMTCELVLREHFECVTHILQTVSLCNAVVYRFVKGVELYSNRILLHY